MTPRHAWICCGSLAVAAGFYGSAGLPSIWQDSPYDRWGGWAALIWAAGVLYLLVSKGWNPHPFWCGAGMGFMALGFMADISLGVHAGLAFCSAGLPRISPLRRAVLVVGALAWMPASGWLASGWVSPKVFGAIRVVWAAVTGVAAGVRK